MNNKLTPHQAQQLTADLIEIVRQNPKELDWLCDSYVYHASSKEVEELRTLIKDEYGYD